MYKLHIVLLSPGYMIELGRLDYGKNPNPDYFGQYWNHDYSNHYFKENMTQLFSISWQFNRELKLVFDV